MICSKIHESTVGFYFFLKCYVSLNVLTQNICYVKYFHNHLKFIVLQFLTNYNVCVYLLNMWIYFAFGFLMKALLFPIWLKSPLCNLYKLKCFISFVYHHIYIWITNITTKGWLHIAFELDTFIRCTIFVHSDNQIAKCKHVSEYNPLDN